METDNNISNTIHSTGAAENAAALKNTFTEHGNEIEEIISNKPPLIVRWGTVYFLFVLLFLALICWFIKYPDIVKTTAKLTSINAPKEVITKTAGQLTNLFIKEGEQVKAGTVLGYIESTANPEEVFYLSGRIDTISNIISKSEIEKLPPYINTSYQNLGELQQSYQTFLQSFLTFRNYISGGFYLRKKSMLINDMSLLNRQHQTLSQQKDLNSQDLELSQKTFEANESLKTDKVISDLDYRNEKSKLINKKLTLPQINSSLISNEAQQNEKQKEIAELENTIAQQKNIFIQSLNTLKSEVANWKKKYILMAPVDGKISFATFLQQNQELGENKTICFVNPDNTSYYAEVYIPQTNFGKISLGQRVLLKFPSYPFQEYGSVVGNIDFISNIPTDSGYLAKVTLPNALNTNYKKQVQFREGLQAEANIVTKDMRLLQRFYYGIAGQINKY